MRKKAAIETGHQLPQKSKVTSLGVLIDLSGTIRSLEVGQSFVVDGKEGRVSALQAGTRLGIPLTSRKIFTFEGQPEQFRIWRKEKE